MGSQSFSGSTQVELANGATLPIDQVQPGDQVLATDTTTGVTGAHTVDALWVHHDSDLLDVTVTTANGSSVIHTTDNHLIFDLRTHHWTEAKDLRRGDHVRTQDGTTATVTATTTVAGSADMWDLTVDGVHDFYVVVTGGTGVLVHNEDGDQRCGGTGSVGDSSPAGGLSPGAARDVYLAGERDIAAQADELAKSGISPEERAQNLFEARNALRTQARGLMADQDMAAALEANEPNMTWSEIVTKYEAQGLSGNELWNAISDAASHSRPSVNKLFGLSP